MKEKKRNQETLETVTEKNSCGFWLHPSSWCFVILDRLGWGMHGTLFVTSFMFGNTWVFLPLGCCGHGCTRICSSPAFISFEHMPRSGITESHSGFYWPFEKLPDCSLKWLHNFIPHHGCTRVPTSPRSHQHMGFPAVVAVVFIVTLWGDVGWSHSAFDLWFPDDKGCWAPLQSSKLVTNICSASFGTRWRWHMTPGMWMDFPTLNTSY